MNLAMSEQVMKEVVDLLDKEFSKQLNANPKFTLRAFARYLEVSPATLSRVLSRQIKVTPKVFEVIATKLDISELQYKYLMDGLKVNKNLENIRTVEHLELNHIKMETFNLIADWYHYAILHMCSLKDFSKDPEWIAKRLGIEDVELIRTAIERLIEFKMLGIDKNQNLYKTSQFNVVLDYNVSSIAMRERQKQILKLSAEKIDSIPLNSRDHSTITIPLDEDLMPEIKERIKKFRRSLGNFIVKNNLNAQEVYELQISFFPLLTKEK